MGRLPNHRLVRIHFTYTVEEIARLLGRHRSTVRVWIKRGLPTIDKERPMLVRGVDLVEFIKAQRRKNKRPTPDGQIYCVRCREPKRPAGDVVTYEASTATGGNLVGLCPACDALLFRRVNVAKLAEVAADLEVSVHGGGITNRRA